MNVEVSVYMYGGKHSRAYSSVMCTCVLCCIALFVCFRLLASFFLPSHLSFKNMYMNNDTCSTIHVIMT